MVKEKKRRYYTEFFVLFFIFFAQIAPIKLINVPIGYFVICFFFLLYAPLRELFDYWKLLLPLFLFVCYLMLTSVWSSDPYFVIFSASRYLVMLAFILLVVRFLRVLGFYNVVYCYVSVVALATLIAVFHIVIGSYDFYNRFLISIFGERADPNFSAFILAASCLLSVLLYFRGKVGIWLSLYFLFFFLMTFSRGAMLSIILSISFFVPISLVLHRKINSTQLRYLALVFVVFFTGFVFFFYMYFFHYDSLSSYFRFSSISRAAGRLEIFESFLISMKDSWIFGSGYNLFYKNNVVEFLDGREVSMALHSSYLEFLYGGGIVGLLWFLVCMFYLIHRMTHLYYKVNRFYRVDYIVLVVVFLFSLFLMLFLNIETHRTLWFVYALCFYFINGRDLRVGSI